MTVFYQIFCCIRKGNISVQIAPLLGKSFNLTVGGSTIVIACVTNHEGGFMDRRIIGFYYLLKVLVREVSLNTLSRSLITCFEDVDAFCEHRV
jgi:hypothetical protein